MSTTVFGPKTLTSNVGAWNGYTDRQKIAAADLASTTQVVGTVVVSFTLSGVSGVTTMNAYIGNWTGTTQNYDGSQAQLLFGGSATKTVPAGNPSFDSDAGRRQRRSVLLAQN
jgi:hypothetical protein